MFSQQCLCSAKMNIFLLSSLLNMIINLVSRWVGGLVVGWSVGRWSVDLIKPVFIKPIIKENFVMVSSYIDETDGFL